MNWTSIITALIAGLATGGTTFFGLYTLINWRLAALEHKVDIHNGYAEKFAESTRDKAEMRQDIALIKQDISYLRREYERDIKQITEG